MNGPGRPKSALTLSAEERAALERMATTTVAPSLRLRATIILLSAGGASNTQVANTSGVSAATVGKWRDRFIRLGVSGLSDSTRSGRPRTEGRAALLVAATTADSSSRRLAAEYGVSQSTAARARREERAHRELQGRQPTDPPPDHASRRRAGGGPAARHGSAAVPDAGTAEPKNRPSELLSDRLYATLRGWILRGDLAVGQRVVEAEIARTLGTSPTPAREAIRRLAHEGLITNRPHIGHFVTRASPVQTREARDVRVVLETAAARSAAGRISESSLASLRHEVQQLIEAAERDDIGAFREADMRFHREAMVAGGNSMLVRVWQLMEPALWDLQAVSDAHYAGDWHRMAAMHGELVDVLVAGDPEEAARMFSAHARGEGSKVRPARLRQQRISSPLPSS